MTEDGVVYVAITSGSSEIDGKNYTFHRNVTRVLAPHPLLDQCPHNFKPVTSGLAYGTPAPEIEQATAAPGEKRGGGTPDKAKRK